jgi:hypothetical protein
LWLLANPLRTHGIGESGSKTITGWLLMGAADAKHIWWLDTNSFTGLLLPQSLIASCTCLLFTQMFAYFNRYYFISDKKSIMLD